MVLRGIISNYGLVTLFAATFVQCVKIHEHMTADEIATVFNASPDNMPDYDVVTVRHNLYRPSSSNLHLEFNAFGKKIDAYLQPSDGVLTGKKTPVWFASTQSNGTISYKKMSGDIIETVVRTYISLSEPSTIVAFMPEGEKVSFKGYINAMKVIPLPDDIRRAARSRREREFPKSSRTLLDIQYHVIVKSTSMINETDTITQLEGKIWNETNHSKSKRSTKDIIYPSILVVTDFAPLCTIEDDFAYYDEIVYQLAFWNAVDMRFRHVDNPKIRLRIAGIIIGVDRGATPYANKYRKENVITLPNDYVDMIDYWFAMREHPDFPLEAYDIVATVTDNDMMFTREGEEGPILGYAFTGSLCLRLSSKQCASAIITDKYGFSGVFPATHELGHILGLKHDGKTGDECDESNHYMMQPFTIPGPKNLEWSLCSLKSLSYFLRDYEVNCVDEPADFHPPGTTVQRLLPGDIVSTHMQCQARGYDRACAASTDTCTNMKCCYTGWRMLKKGWSCKDVGPAAEGTACSPGHKCLDAVCQCVTEECLSENK